MLAAVCTEKVQFGTMLFILGCPLEKKGGEMSHLTLRAVEIQPEVPYCHFSVSVFSNMYKREIPHPYSGESIFLMCPLDPEGGTPPSGSNGQVSDI